MFWYASLITGPKLLTIFTVLNVSVFGVFWSICGKIRTRKTPNPDSFYAVYSIWALTNALKSFFKSGPPRYQKLIRFKPITVFAFLIFVDIFDLFLSLFDLLINSTSKKEIIIVGDSMIKHMNGREVVETIQSKSDAIQVPPQMIL